MKNLNELRELHTIKVPEELKQRTMEAARALRREEFESVPQHLTKKPRVRFGTARRILAAACAFALILGGTAAWRARGTEQATGDAVADAIAHSFGFVAYAADDAPQQAPAGSGGSSRIMFDPASGVDDLEKGFFSGCVFKVTGEGIRSVSASMDRGGLYRTKTVACGDSDRGEWVRSMHEGTNPEIDGADHINVWGYDENTMFADLCWKLDNGFADEYDPDASYGFWAPPAPQSEIDPDADLREEWHSRVDTFDGATLTLTVTFTDGTQQTQTIKLHTGKLAVEYPDETSGPRYTGEVLTDEQAAERGYLYGVYADIEQANG